LAGIRFRLYIDESGDHSYKNLDDINRRYLGLCGCMLEIPYANNTFIPEMDSLKRRHFPRHDPDEPVILHRNDIINRRGPFHVLRDDMARKNFDDNLLEFFSEQQYKVITVVIDKQEHLAKYGQFAWHPYHYCLTAMLDRYCGLLNVLGDKGDVLAESRGGTEDNQLKGAYERLYEDGSLYHAPAFFQRVLTSTEIKLKNKKANIAGLQLADLLAHPSKQEILRDKKIIREKGLGNYCKRIIPVLKNKYNRQIYSGRIDGYGKVFLG